MPFKADTESCIGVKEVSKGETRFADDNDTVSDSPLSFRRGLSETIQGTRSASAIGGVGRWLVCRITPERQAVSWLGLCSSKSRRVEEGEGIRGRR